MNPIYLGLIFLVVVVLVVGLVYSRGQGYQSVRNWCESPDGTLVPCAGTLSANNGDRVFLGDDHIPTRVCVEGYRWDQYLDRCVPVDSLSSNTLAPCASGTSCQCRYGMSPGINPNNGQCICASNIAWSPCNY